MERVVFIPIIHTQILWGRYCREWQKDKDGNEKFKNMCLHQDHLPEC